MRNNIFVLFVVFCVCLVECAPPSREHIESLYNGAKPGENIWERLLQDATQNFELFAGDQLASIGKENAINFLQSNWPIKTWNSDFLDIIPYENSVTVYSRISAVSIFDCTAVVHTMDILTFNDNGKLIKIEFYVSEDVQQIYAQMSCSHYFSREDLIRMYKNLWYHSNGTPKLVNTSDRQGLEEFFDKAAEVQLSPETKFVGIDAIYNYLQQTPFYSFFISSNNFFIEGSTLIAPQTVTVTTRSKCVFHSKDVVRIEFTQEGKLKKYHVMVSTLGEGAMKMCGDNVKNKEHQEL